MTTPAFAYPMIGILSPEVCEEPGETGVREFADHRVLDVVWEGDLTARAGMLLVDVEGRAWRVIEVKKLGRSLNPLARYWRVAHEVVEEPSMTFEALKGLLLETLKTQRSAYNGLHPAYLREERRSIRNARSLRDIVRTQAEVEALNAPTSISWVDAVMGDGRSSRLEFILGAAALVTMARVIFGPGSLLIGWHTPTFLMAVLGIAIVLAMAALVSRRIHDLGIGALWALGAFFTAIISGVVLDELWGADGRIFAIGVYLLLLFVGLLAAWPSQPRPNRFGRFPANRAGRLAAAAATADDRVA